MEPIFIYSRLVDPSEVARTGSFTSLPVRINHRDDMANAATQQLLADWRAYVGDGNEKEYSSCLCELGNWCSLVFPESIPNRLAILSYLTDLGLIHDDTSEEMKFEDAVREHDDLGAALDVNDRRVLSKGSKSDKLKKLVAQFLLDAMSIDKEKGALMVDAYRTKWLAIMEHRNTEEFVDLKEYLAFRRENGGMDPFWAMARFGMDISLSDEELHSVEGIFQSADNALVLTNDFYSYEREHAASQRVGAGRIVNSVEMFMRTKQLSSDEAKQAIKEKIIAYEQEYVARKEAFYDTNPNTSISLRRWIEVAGIIIGGNHYWCTRCPRHHAYASREASTASATTSVYHDTFSSTSDTSMSHSETDISSQEDTSEPSQSRFSSKETAKPLGDLAVSHLAGTPVWPEVDRSTILEPCTYIGTMPSKGVRSQLIDALNDWLHVPKASLEIITEIVRRLHDASLILDDIEDNSPLRRGKPAVHTIYGHSQAINSANYMFVQAVQASRQLQNTTATDILLEDLEGLYVGQSLDLNWKFALHCPSEEEYLTMIDHKTGGMFRMLLRLMQAESHHHLGLSFDHLPLLFGRFFQIRDDYMNLVSQDYTNQKGFCEDFDEGKLSFPVVYCLQRSLQSRTQILGIFRQRPTASLGAHVEPLPKEAKAHILDCLKASGAIEASLEYVNRLEGELEAAIAQLEIATGESNPMLRLLLKRLSLKESAQGKAAKLEFESFSLPDTNQRVLGLPHPEGTISPLALRPIGQENITLDDAIDAIKHLQEQDGDLTRKLSRHGTLLFRGLPIHNASEFSRFAHAFGFQPHELIGNVKGGGELAPTVSFANEAPTFVQIYSHNESAHVPNAPGYVMFYGHHVPDAGLGGESPISSSLELFHRVNAEVPGFISELASKGMLSKVTYKTDSQYPGGSTLLEAFGKEVLETDDKATRRAKIEAQINRYGRAGDTTWEWIDDADGLGKEILILTHHLPAIRLQAGTQHPALFTGLAAYWKNLEKQLALEKKLANSDGLAKVRGGQMQQLYGDGSPIQHEYLAKLAAITDELRVLHQWVRGDVLVFDNVIAQHGREPWKGAPEDRVVMASMWDGDLPGAYTTDSWARVVQPSAE